MRRVVVFGVFDGLHPGHLYFLHEAKKHGDHLTVVVTRDARVRAEKKHMPVFNERERLEMVCALKWIDRAVLGDKAGEWRILKRLQPDVVCVGYDQKAAWVKRCTPPESIRIIHINAYKPRQYHSARIKYARH